MRIRHSSTYTFGTVVLMVLIFGLTGPVAAEPLPRPSVDIDDLPEDGWELVAYLNGDPDSDDPNDWPTLFKFHTDEDGGHTVKAECTQPLTPIPDIGTDFHREGEYLISNKPGEQNKFRIIEEIEPPKPKLKSFSVDCDCATPGAQSDEISIRVKAKDEDGDGFKGADVRIFIGDDQVASGKTNSSGNFNHTQAARNLIGSTIRVEVENLDPKTVEITEALFEPCTGRCDSLSGAYDPASDSISLTVKGAQPGWDAVIRDVTMGGSTSVCSGKLDGNGELSCTKALSQGQWGLFKFTAQVGGSAGPTCQVEVDTPAPVKLVLHKDCTPHGKNSDDMIFWGEMLDQNDQRFTKPLTLTINLPNGEQMTRELVNGAFGEIPFEDAKDYIGKEVEFFWAGGGHASFEIKRSIFDPCQKPEPTPTPTQPPPPGFGRDPKAPPVALARYRATPTPYDQGVSSMTIVPYEMSLRSGAVVLVALLVTVVVAAIWRRF